jgi:ribosomal protein L29
VEKAKLEATHRIRQSKRTIAAQKTPPPKRGGKHANGK